MTGLRDLAVYDASRQRRPWRVSWSVVADQLEVHVENLDGESGDLAEVAYAFTALGISGSTQLETPAPVAAVLSYLTETVGNVAAEHWRVSDSRPSRP